MTLAKKIPLMLSAALLALMTACTPFQKIHNDADFREQLNGSWTVMHDGKNKVKDLTPPAIIIFDTSNHKLSGLDGCNRFSGSYTLEGGVLKASVATTRMACQDNTANHVSQIMHTLFAQGAEVVSVNFMSVNALVLRNKAANAELRLGSTAQLAESAKK